MTETHVFGKHYQIPLIKATQAFGKYYQIPLIKNNLQQSHAFSAKSMAVVFI